MGHPQSELPPSRRESPDRAQTRSQSNRTGSLHQQPCPVQAALREQDAAMLQRLRSYLREFHHQLEEGSP